ncbi:MAG: hypothetical protein JWP35_4137, partial [Caulobacter sp.]|nr:hypothetical protein [Caulobacter sp.]
GATAAPASAAAVLAAALAEQPATAPELKAEALAADAPPLQADAAPVGQPQAQTTTPLAAHVMTAALAGAVVRGSPETVAKLSSDIARKLEQRSTRFDLALTPEGLGTVNVRLEIGAEGRLTAAMSFDTPQAAAEMRGRADDLRQSLEAAGFDLSGGMSFDVAGQNGGQGQRTFDNDNQSGRSFAGQAFQAALDVADEPPTANPYSRLSAASGLDIRI